MKPVLFYLLLNACGAAERSPCKSGCFSRGAARPHAAELSIWEWCRQNASGPLGGDRANGVKLNERCGRSGGYVLELLTKPRLENIGAFLRPISQQCPLSRKGLSAFFVSCAEKIACVFCGPRFVNSPVSRRLSVNGPTGPASTIGLAVGGVCVESFRRRRKRRPRKDVGLPP